MAQEIHELNQTVKALRANVEQYRSVTDDIPILICRFLPGGKITYVNEAYCNYFTCTSEQLVGSSFLSLIPEMEHEIVEDFDHNLPETFGDTNRLEQVFVNIIRNAGDAMREVSTTKRLTIKTERTGLKHQSWDCTGTRWRYYFRDFK